MSGAIVETPIRSKSHTSTRNALLIEELTSNTYPLIHNIHDLVGCGVLHANDWEEAQAVISANKSFVDVIVATVGRELEEPARLHDRVRRMVHEGFARRPRIVALGPESAPANVLAKYIDLDISFLIRENPAQIGCTLRGIYWLLGTR